MKHRYKSNELEKGFKNNVRWKPLGFGCGEMVKLFIFYASRASSNATFSDWFFQFYQGGKDVEGNKYTLMKNGFAGLSFLDKFSLASRM